MAANTEMIDQLVSDSALKSLDILNTKLTSSYEEMEKLLSKVQMLSTELSKPAKDYIELAKSIEKVEKVNKQTSIAMQESQRIEREREKLQHRITTAYSDEVLELERLRKIMRDISTVRRNVIREQTSQTGSTEKLRAQINILNNSIDRMNEKTRNSSLGQSMIKDVQNLTKQVKELEGQTSRFQRNAGNYPQGGGIGGIFTVFAGNILTKAVEGIKQLISAAREWISTGVEMAAKAEGVSAAFRRLDSPNLLKNLREATRGTVNDLELMQAAVRADTFNIPVERLGTLLRFAQQRAQETGQSVDYLTNSIVDGIGRKSPLILDNLGISAERLRQEVAKTGDFATATINIVNQELEKQGELPLTAANKAQIASVKWQNTQMKIGESLLFVKNAWSGISSAVADLIGGMVERYAPTILKYIQDITNGLIDIYNSSAMIRIAAQSGIATYKTLFQILKLGIKDTLASVMAFVNVTKSAFTMDFAGAKKAFDDFNISLFNNRKTFVKEISENIKAGTEDAKKQLDHIDITSTIQVNKRTSSNNNQISEDQKKAIEAEKKALQELEQFRIQQEAESQKRILENTKISYEERMEAVNEFENKRAEALIQAADNQLKDQTLTASQRLLVEEKLQAELNKLSDEGGKFREQILKDYIDQQNNILNNGLSEKNIILDQGQQEELSKYAQMYAVGELSTEEYEQKRLEITKEYAKARFDTEIEFLRESLEVSGLTEEQKKAIEKKILEADLKYNKEINNQKIKDDEEAAKKRIKIEEDLAKKRKEILKDLYESGFDLVSSLFEAGTEKNLQRLEKESDDNQQWRDQEIERIQRQEEQQIISKEQADAQRADIDNRTKQRELMLEQQRKQIQERQARFEKAAALTKVAIDTAAAIMGLWKNPGFPAAIPLAVLVGALGATQAAIIAARPIPKYKDGTDYHPGGWARVGDGGKQEMVILPTGEIWKTPATDTYAYLPKGTEVLPDYKKALMDILIDVDSPYNMNREKIIISENREQLEKMDKQINVLTQVTQLQRHTLRQSSKNYGKGSMYNYIN